jgi:hypothetical protein
VKTYLLGLVLLLSCAAPPQHAPDWSSPAEGGRRTSDYWLNKLAAGEADRVLLDDAGIARLNAGYRALDDGPRDVTDDAVAARDVVNRQVISAFALIEGKVAKGELGLSKELLRQASERAERVLPVDEYRLAADELTLWCIPTLDPILKQPGGTIEFDRNRCSEVHVGEVVRILGRTSEGWSLVRASYAIGWLRSPSVLGPVLTIDEVRAYRDGHPRFVVTRDRGVPEAPALRLGTGLPASSDGTARLWQDGSWRSIPPGRTLEPWPLLFTRRNVLAIALAHLGSAYGWGGYREGLDCSRFLQSIFATFGIALPRNSIVQASHGSEVTDVKGLTRPTKIARLRNAARCGVPVLQMPGHIMLYLGEEAEDGSGAGSFAVSSVGEVTVPCTSCEAGSPDHVVPINRVEVTSLATGDGTARGSWLDRIERVVTIGVCEAAAR